MSGNSPGHVQGAAACKELPLRLPEAPPVPCLPVLMGTRTGLAPGDTWCAQGQLACDLGSPPWAREAWPPMGGQCRCGRGRRPAALRGSLLHPSCPPSGMPRVSPRPDGGCQGLAGVHQRVPFFTCGLPLAPGTLTRVGMFSGPVAKGAASPSQPRALAPQPCHTASISTPSAFPQLGLAWPSPGGVIPKEGG